MPLPFLAPFVGSSLSAAFIDERRVPSEYLQGPACAWGTVCKRCRIIYPFSGLTTGVERRWVWLRAGALAPGGFLRRLRWWVEWVMATAELCSASPWGAPASASLGDVVPVTELEEVLGNLEDSLRGLKSSSKQDTEAITNGI